MKNEEEYSFGVLRYKGKISVQDFTDLISNLDGSTFIGRNGRKQKIFSELEAKPTGRIWKLGSFIPEEKSIFSFIEIDIDKKNFEKVGTFTEIPLEFKFGVIDLDLIAKVFSLDNKFADFEKLGSVSLYNFISQVYSINTRDNHKILEKYKKILKLHGITKFNYLNSEIKEILETVGTKDFAVDIKKEFGLKDDGVKEFIKEIKTCGINFVFQ